MSLLGLTEIFALTEEETAILRDAVYKIADARESINEINNQMISSSRWSGQADIAAVASSLDELCRTQAGSIGYFLEKL